MKDNKLDNKWRVNQIHKCRYYKGENLNPYIGGRAFWWNMEKETIERGFEIRIGELSQLMEEYIREKMWGGDGQPNTTIETALKRAKELYDIGEWSRDYINRQWMSLKYAVQLSQSQ